MSTDGLIDLGEREIRGRNYRALLEPRGGSFFFEVDGERVARDETLAGSIAKVTAIVKKAEQPLDVEFVRLSDGERGRVTGIHAGSQKYLVHWYEVGARTQEGGHLSVRRPTDDESHARLRELIEAQRAADRNLREYRKAHETRLDKLVDEARAFETEAAS